MADLRALLGSPSICPLSATERHAEVLAEVLAESGATDNLVDDAHIVDAVPGARRATKSCRPTRTWRASGNPRVRNRFRK